MTAAAINFILAQHAAEIRRIGKRVVGDVIEIGQRLTECKRICGHGNWLPWLDREFGWTDDTALNFMRVYELSESRNFRDLSLPVSSLYLLAAPSTPAEARDAVLGRAANGERVTHAEVQATIAEAKSVHGESESRERVGERHVCWQCRVRAPVGEVRQHSHPAYEDVWLHDSCVVAFEAFAASEAARPTAADLEPAEATQRGLVTGVAMSPHEERGRDCYETPPVAVRTLLDVEPLSGTIWEPACGPGAIVGVLRAAGHRVVATDIESYGCPDSLGGVDFLEQTSAPKGAQTVLTNPPYMHAGAFVRHALTLVPRVVMLMRLAFIESQGRSDILDGGQLARVHVFRNRLPMMHRFGWSGPETSSAIAFAWFVWDRDHRGPTELHRISWQPGDDELAAPPAAAESDGDGLDIPGFLRRVAP